MNYTFSKKYIKETQNKSLAMSDSCENGRIKTSQNDTIVMGKLFHFNKNFCEIFKT